MVFSSGSTVKNLPAMQETQEVWVKSLGWEDSLEEEMATHSSILAGKILWTEELQLWATIHRIAENCTRLSTELLKDKYTPRVHNYNFSLPLQAKSIII